MLIFLGAMGVLAVFFVIYVELIFDPSTLKESELENYTSALRNAYLILGALVGVFIALPIERHLVKFNEGGKWYTQALKIIIGLPLVLLILEGLKAPLNMILPENTFARAIRYMLVVIFAICVYPISFRWFNKLENRIEAARKFNKKLKGN